MMAVGAEGNAPVADAGPRRLALPGVVLGIGLGGFVDGILLHQILQWHHMLSSRTPPDTVAGLELNTLFDGLFHAAAWVLTVVGVWLVLTATRSNLAALAGRRVLAGVLLGWGCFNLIEGIVDHYLIGMHHVRPGPDQALYDAAFLVWGGAFVVMGWVVARAARTRAGAAATPSAG